MPVNNALIVILLTLSTTVSATTFYIDPSGKDILTNNGSNGSPWRTLAYACIHVKNSGDIIHVNAGTYIESVQSILAVGVSIEGAGVTSIIKSQIGGTDETISLYSATEGTNGNQHISNLKMDGDALTAYSAIRVHSRSNVSIHDLVIIDFQHYGVLFNGTWSTSEPTNYSVGNSFFNNIVTNCSDYVGSDKYGSGQGALMIGGQQDMLIYNNVLNQTARGDGDNGYLIKFSADGFVKGVKIYDNIITKAPYDGITWDFAIELWNCRGGVEIYNNAIQGSIDLGGIETTDAGNYGFAVKIYNNTIGQAALRTREETGIIVELTQTGGLYIYNNLFKNLCTPIVTYQNFGNLFEDFYVYSNLFSNIGVSGSNTGSAGYGIEFYKLGGTNNVKYSNINIVNNTFYAGTSGSPRHGIEMTLYGSASDITIRNNIIQGFRGYPINMSSSGTLNTVSVENNIFYDNTRGNAPVFENTIPTNNTIQNNIISNPLFVSSSDFHLQAGSPAIGKGLKVAGITNDYDGNIFNDPPSIGAFEYYLEALPVYQNSVIENVSPTLLEMTYNLSLANSVPANSAFNVQVNSVVRPVNSVSFSGNKVKLTLSSAVSFVDYITVSYTKPSVNPLQTATGREAESISNRLVTNRCNDTNKPNDLPVLVIKNEADGFSGFVYEIDASGSYDLNNDILTYNWTIPNNVSVSSTNTSKIKFLSPVVNTSQIINFQLKVSDGKAIVTKNIPINIVPYKPELDEAKIINTEASSYQVSDYPKNASDGNLTTKWSAIGDNQWFFFTLAESFKISHLEIAFLQGQKYSSYFDIYASKDNLIWEPILTNAASCNFSGDIQVFDFPLLKTNTDYSYLKLVGHGNSLNNLNNISEFKIFGSPQQIPGSGYTPKSNIIIYPNPAKDFINISIDEPTTQLYKVRIIEFSGKIVFEEVLNPVITSIHIPISLKSGVYIVDLAVDNLILFAQKLIIRN